MIAVLSKLSLNITCTSKTNVYVVNKYHIYELKMIYYNVQLINDDD